MKTHTPRPPLKQIWIDKSLRNSWVVDNIRENLPKYPEYKNAQLEEVSDYKETIANFKKQGIDFGEAKKYLLIYPEKGDFFHACPGSDGVLCCRYYVLDFGMNCVYDCDYCYLQTYLTSPLPTIAANIDEMLGELSRKIKSNPNLHWRIGTGEYTDSLALDHLTGLSTRLIQFFEQHPNATLELKTKSVEIERLLQKPTAADIVVSWSLNPPQVAAEVEHGCPTIDQRLQAAAQVASQGLHVAFHFDPMFVSSGDTTSSPLENYRLLVERLFDSIPEEKIRWISLGAFRYTPGLREKLRLRRPHEFITRAEMVQSQDGKLRYPGYERSALYQDMKRWILERSPEMMIYLCMETKPMWRNAFGYEPSGPGMLDAGFDKRRILLDRGFQNKLLS